MIAALITLAALAAPALQDCSPNPALAQFDGATCGIQGQVCYMSGTEVKCYYDAEPACTAPTTGTMFAANVGGGSDLHLFGQCFGAQNLETYCCQIDTNKYPVTAVTLYGPDETVEIGFRKLGYDLDATTAPLVALAQSGKHSIYTEIFGSNSTNTDYQETLIGSDGDDYIDALSGDDIIYGEGGTNEIWAGWGDDEVYGGPGDDTIYGYWGDDYIHGGDGTNNISGENGNDTLIGGSGVDTLDGGDGKDIMNAGDGNDYLFGGAGNDYLFGGRDNDELYGHGGSDTLCDNGMLSNGWPIAQNTLVGDFPWGADSSSHSDKALIQGTNWATTLGSNDVEVVTYGWNYNNVITNMGLGQVWPAGTVWNGCTIAMNAN